jgi:hypothetical protein
VVWDNQHRDAAADALGQQLDKAIDLAFEARRDVVDGRQEQSISHESLFWAADASRASGSRVH